MDLYICLISKVHDLSQMFADSMRDDKMINELLLHQHYH